MIALAATLAVAVLTGCATTATKPAYPALDAGTPVSVLKLENTMADSAFALKLMAPIGIRITLDGFSPADREKLKAGGQIIPTGATEVRLPAGSHTLTHHGMVLGGGIYYFNPVEMPFDSEEGKTYVIRFKQASTLGKLCYAVEYEGWPKEQSSQWPNEVRFANPLFGR